MYSAKPHPLTTQSPASGFRVATLCFHTAMNNPGVLACLIKVINVISASSAVGGFPDPQCRVRSGVFRTLHAVRAMRPAREQFPQFLRTGVSLARSARLVARLPAIRAVRVSFALSARRPAREPLRAASGLGGPPGREPLVQLRAKTLSWSQGSGLRPASKTRDSLCGSLYNFNKTSRGLTRGL